MGPHERDTRESLQSGTVARLAPTAGVGGVARVLGAASGRRAGAGHEGGGRCGSGVG